jgi:hypothetical protein
LIYRTLKIPVDDSFKLTSFPTPNKNPQDPGVILLCLLSGIGRKPYLIKGKKRTGPILNLSSYVPSRIPVRYTW